MSPFDALLAEAMANAPRFGHREHVHVTWLAVRRFGPTAAISIVGDGIQRTARYAGAPQKYHATISRAWVELVACHALPTEPDFATFAEHNPALLDKRLLRHFYRPATLASPAARSGWVPPDLAPIPHPTPSSLDAQSSHAASSSCTPSSSRAALSSDAASSFHGALSSRAASSSYAALSSHSALPSHGGPLSGGAPDRCHGDDGAA